MSIAVAAADHIDSITNPELRSLLTLDLPLESANTFAVAHLT
jgi:hypothetical protein